MNRANAIRLILSCLENLNSERAPEAQIPLGEATELLSDSSQLDSLAFVSFTTDLEERLLSETGVMISIFDVALDADGAPLETVSKLADLVARLTGG